MKEEEKQIKKLQAQKAELQKSINDSSWDLAIYFFVSQRDAIERSIFRLKNNLTRP